MLNRPDLGAALDRMQGSAATALALAALVLVFVYLVPRQGDIAAAMQSRRAEAVAARAAAAERVASAVHADAGTAATAGPALSAPDAPDPQPPAASEAAAVADPPAPVAALPPQLLLRPVALDTATILIRQGRVRLAGIRAAPLARRCGENGPDGWFCGVEARTHFRSWLRARSIACDVPPGFGAKAEEVEARCALSGEDIGGWLVANGYAEALPGGAYAEAEQRAKAGKLGIWADRRTAN